MVPLRGSLVRAWSGATNAQGRFGEPWPVQSRAVALKVELAAFAAETGLKVTVSHLPPGTSKWNQIEHRLFSQITMNRRGGPLKTHQIIVDLISSTTTTTGLTVVCTLDTGQYPTGLGYTDKDVRALPLQRHDFYGDWNYALLPSGDTPT